VSEAIKICLCLSLKILGVNFINILHECFSYESALSSFSLVTFWQKSTLVWKMRVLNVDEIDSRTYLRVLPSSSVVHLFEVQTTERLFGKQSRCQFHKHFTSWFSLESAFHSFSLLTVWLCNFLSKLAQKLLVKMFVELTKGWRHRTCSFRSCSMHASREAFGRRYQN